DYPLKDYLKNTGVSSFIAIPIREHWLVRELVTLSFSQTQVFDVQQRRLYEALTDQIGIVLQSHRLLRDTQPSAAQLSNQVRVLQLVNQLSATISAVEDEQALLDQSVRVLVEAVGVDHCAIVMINPQETTATIVSEYPNTGVIGEQTELSNYEPYQLIRE